LDLNTVVVDVVKMLGRLIANHVEGKVLLAQDLGRIKADPGQIEQLILNLAVNACDAMPHGGRLLLETANVQVDENYARKHAGAPIGKHVMLAVSDTGIGMDNDVQAHIFEPFFTTKEPGKGTGLGLSMVYGTVKQMGGAVLVRSEPGTGTTFEIFLPQVEERNEATVSESGQVRSVASSVASAGTETVLLVEDQDGIREVVREYLQGKGYTVLHAIDGEDALKVAGEYKHQIHLLVTDVIMPKIGGQELARRLMPLRPQMKALFMSGHPEHASSGGKNLALDENIAVLQKPFQLDTLGRKMRNVLDDNTNR
jgi:CheY-like chemotaxis protein